MLKRIIRRIKESSLRKEGQKVDFIINGMEFKGWYYMKHKKDKTFVEDLNGGPLFCVADVDSWKLAK